MSKTPRIPSDFDWTRSAVAVHDDLLDLYWSINPSAPYEDAHDWAERNLDLL
jgi:hypothetical protein